MDVSHADGIIAAPGLAMLAASTAVSGLGSIGLSELPTGAEARVVSVTLPAQSGTSVDVQRRLSELGFLPGEKLRIVARGFLGKEPIAVRIGTGTFALRMFEAAWIRVCPEQPKRS